MTLPDRITVNLATEDSELDAAAVDELVERSECSNRSELIRRLLSGESIDDLVDDLDLDLEQE